MKVFITLAAVCMFAGVWANSAIKIEKKVSESHEKCLISVSLSNLELEKLASLDLVQATDNMKCFVACLYQEMGVLKKRRVQERALLEIVSTLDSKKLAKAIVNTCKGVKGANLCELGYEILICINRAPEGYQS